MNLVIGQHVIEELIKFAPKRILKVYSIRPKNDSKKSKCLRLIQSLHIPIEYVSKDKLTKLSSSTSHQGIAALVKKRELMGLDAFLRQSQKKKRSFVLLLDSITDPHNFGAILRSSECLGVSAVIWSKNRGVSITPTVSKVSSGASEFVTLIMVANSANAVDSFKKEGFSIISSTVSVDSISLFSFTYPDKTVLILGSEGEGVRPLLRKKCDHHLHIPMKGKIDSLNVSNAAAVFLSRIT